MVPDNEPFVVGDLYDVHLAGGTVLIGFKFLIESTDGFYFDCPCCARPLWVAMDDYDFAEDHDPNRPLEDIFK